MTDRSQTMNALRDSEERYRRLFETAQDGILILNAETGAITDANPFITDSLGYTLQELLGKRLWEIGAFADVKDSKAAFEQLQQEEYIRYNDLPLKTKEGQQRHVEFVSNVYLVSGKKVIQCNIRDITDRKQTEEKMREIDERFSNAFENAPTGMALVSPEGRWLKTNRALTELLGYSEEEFLDRSIAETTFPDDITSSLDNIRLAIDGTKKSYHLEKRYVHKQGNVITALLNTSLIRDAQGQPLYFVSHLQDITERKQAEVTLKESEEKFRAITDNSADPIFIADNQGKYVYVNNKAARMLGYTVEELLSFTIVDISPKHRMEEYFQIFQRLLRDGKVFTEIELVANDGTIVPTDFNAVVLPNGYLYASCRDISKRKLIEKTIRESEKRFKALFDQAPIAIALLDLDGHPVLSNETLTEMVGYSKEELSQMKFSDFTYPDDVDKDLEQFNDLIEGKISTYGMEKRYVHKNGNIVWVNLSVTILRDEQGVQREVLGIAKDITERKLTELALLESNEKFHQLADNITDAFWIRSPDMSKVHYVSPAFEKIWGRTVESLYAHPEKWPEFIHPDDRERVQQAFDALTGENSSLNVEYRIVRTDGEIRLVHVRGFQVRNEHNTLIRHIGIVTDITERKAAEGIQRESARRFKEMLENIDLFALMLDREGRVTFCNDYLLRLTGYTRERVIGQNWFSMFIPPETPITQLFVDSMANGSLPQHFENELITATGERRLISWNNIELRDKDGTVIGSSSIGEDITERSREKVALELVNNQLTNLYNNLPEAVFSVDMISNQMLQASPAHKTVFGHSAEEFYKNPKLWREIIIPEDKSIVDASFPNLLTGKNVIHQYRIIRPDKMIRWIETIIKPTLDDHAVLIRIDGIASDITDRKETEDRLKQSEEKYRSLIETLPDGFYRSTAAGRFLDVNLQMATMLGYSSKEELLQIDIPTDLYFKSDDRDVRSDDHKENLAMEIYQLKKKDGTSIWVEDRCRYLKDESGKIQYHEGISRDISDRRLAEEKLKTSEEKYRTIFENIQDVYFEARIDGTIEEISPAIVIVSKGQYQREDLIGHSMFDFYYDAADGQTALEELQKKGSLSDFQMTLKNRDGSKIQCSVTSTIQYNAQGHPERITGILRNITERITAQEALRTSEEQFRLLFDNSLDGILITHPDGSIDSANSAACRIFGATEQELIAAGRNGIVDTTDPRLPSALQERDTTGKFSGELSLRRKDGRRFPSEVSTALYKDTKGNFVSSMSVRDISERKEAEKQIALLAHTLKSIIECVSVTDMDNTILFVNAAFLKVYGYTEEEIVGKDISVIRTPQITSESSNGILNATLAGGWSGELLNRKKNGEVFPVSLSTSCVRDENGSAVALVGVAADITERRHDEIHLQKSEERYRSLVEFSPSAIIVHNHVTIIYVNPAAVKLLAAHDASELIGKPIRDILHEDHKESVRLRVPNKGSNAALPLSKEKFLRLDGVTIDVEVVSLLIEYDGISAMQDVVRDVTEQKKFQEVLLQSQKNESIGTLAGGIAHDFNNILGIILGYTNIVEKRGTDPKILHSSLTAINQAVMRGAALVRQILTFARKTETSIVPISVYDLIIELVSMLSQTFPKIIQFKNSIEPAIPFILADRVQLHQVFLNLFVNARDAMPKGGLITIDAEILPGATVMKHFPAADKQGYECITVSDTGEGMDEATRKRIFDPFFTTKPQGKGTGLGLPVVYGVIQAHHGFIAVDTILNIGTTFRMYFPVPDSKVIPEGIAPPKEFKEGGTETILVVEDEAPLLDMVRYLLESKGYSVLVAHDGAEAVEIYTKHRTEIALVITDLGLPVMTGLEEYKTLKGIDPDVNVIFASGFIEPEVRTELISYGAKYFLQKPYDMNEILKIIRDALK